MVTPTGSALNQLSALSVFLLLTSTLPHHPAVVLLFLTYTPTRAFKSICFAGKKLMLVTLGHQYPSMIQIRTTSNAASIDW